MAEFQTRIREFRRAKGLSTREMAEKLGTSQPNLTRMETGSQAVTVEWLHKIGYVLGVPPAALVDFETAYATMRGDLRPDRKEWPLFTAEQACVVPVPTIFGMTLNGNSVDAYQIGERDLIFCERAQHFAEDTTGKRHVLHIRDDSGEGLCLATFEDNRFGPGFRPTQGHMPAPWLNLWDERIKRKWRVIAEFKSE